MDSLSPTRCGLSLHLSQWLQFGHDLPVIGRQDVLQKGKPL